MRIRPRLYGFTLIETLLVIAVMSIITALGILSYRRYFITNRIDQTALSMQHVLEGGLAYYVSKGQWPDSHPCDGEPGGSPDFVDNYLPNGHTTSPYGSAYCWHAAGDTEALFWVAMAVPGDEEESYDIAKRIAARLPNSVATSDPSSDDPADHPCHEGACYVKAEVSVPGQSSDTKAGNQLAAVGACKTNQTLSNGTGDCHDTSSSGNQTYHISFKACTSGSNPSLTISPNFIELPQSGAGWSIVHMDASSNGCTNSADSSGHEQCDATITVNVCTDILKCKATNIKNFIDKHPDIAVGASYMVSCQGQ